MLQMCIDMKLFLYGMIATGIVGVWCLIWSNHFYNTAIRDLRRKDKPKGRWTGRLLENSKQRVIKDTESFLRTQLSSGKQMGIYVNRMERGVNVALCASVVLCAVAGYGALKYGYEYYVLAQHGLICGCVVAGLLMLRFCMELSDKQELIVDSWRDYFENPVKPVEMASVEQLETAKLNRGEAVVADKSETAKTNRGETAKVAHIDTKRKQAEAKEKRAEVKAQHADPKERARPEDQITQIAKGIREAAAADSRFAGVLTPEEEKLFREVIREYLN